jgi:redox-regulated HSP33 family molecular chaperone
VLLPRELITSTVINSDTKELYAVLALYVDASGVAFVRQRTLAAQCRCSVRYVSQMLRTLRTNGFITGKFSNPANFYRLKHPP